MPSRQAQLVRRRRDAGLCVRCGEPSERAECPACRAEQRRRQCRGVTRCGVCRERGHNARSCARRTLEDLPAAAPARGRAEKRAKMDDDLPPGW